MVGKYVASLFWLKDQFSVQAEERERERKRDGWVLFCSDPKWLTSQYVAGDGAQRGAGFKGTTAKQWQTPAVVLFNPSTLAPRPNKGNPGQESLFKKKKSILLLVVCISWHGKAKPGMCTV